ncbi:MAG: hypothetical protein GEU71_13110 [Actinobacteria bacterium]|nr:hypothetical protein [Actinomycetota bacterium]
MTGSIIERPGLQQALQDAARGLFDLLLVVRVDRLARSVRALASILEQLDDHDIAFRSATEPFDTASPAGQDDGADARRIRRVRARHDHRARHRRDAEEGSEGRLERRYSSARIRLRPRHRGAQGERRRSIFDKGDIRSLYQTADGLGGHRAASGRAR